MHPDGRLSSSNIEQHGPYASLSSHHEPPARTAAIDSGTHGGPYDGTGTGSRISSRADHNRDERGMDSTRRQIV